MSTLVIGSTAIKSLFPDFNREPKDFDVFSNTQLLKADDCFWHPSFAPWLTSSIFRYATLSELYTIKVSHSYWSLPNNSWDKHMSDIVFLKNKGAKLDEDLHSLLYKVWEEKHGKKKVNLQMDKDKFFTDAVNRIYDHDSIHLSVAYRDRPLYESVFKDNQDIEMDMVKVKTLPFESKVALFREEIYATALERWVIPSNYTISPRLAYAKALKKTIVSLTKGWSAKFIVTNYEVFRKPDLDYVKHHLSKKHLLVKLGS